PACGWRGENLFAVALLEVREDVCLVQAERHLFADLLPQREGRCALQVVARMHRQAAAALTGERLLELLEARLSSGRRAALQHRHQQHDHEPHQLPALSSRAAAGEGTYAATRAAAGAGQMTTTVPSA